MDGTIDPTTQLPEHDPAPDDDGAPSAADLTVILDWTEAALRGEAVPDHALQFEAVDQARALRAERDALRMDMREIVAELDKHLAPADQRPQARIRMWARAMREAQELADSAAVEAIAKARAGAFRKLPPERAGRTFKITIAGEHDLYVTVNCFDDGTPGEIFMKMSKQGSMLSGLMDAFAMSVSRGLKQGVPLEWYCRKMRGLRFPPDGPAGDLGIVSSPIDAAFRRIEIAFLSAPTASAP